MVVQMVQSTDHKNLKYYFPGLSIMKRFPHGEVRGLAGTINKSAEVLTRSKIVFLWAGLAQSKNRSKLYPSSLEQRDRFRARTMNGWHWVPTMSQTWCQVPCWCGLIQFSSFSWQHSLHASVLSFKIIIIIPIFQMRKFRLQEFSRLPVIKWLASGWARFKLKNIILFPTDYGLGFFVKVPTTCLALCQTFYILYLSKSSPSFYEVKVIIPILQIRSLSPREQKWLHNLTWPLEGTAQTWTQAQIQVPPNTWALILGNQDITGRS